MSRILACTTGATDWQQFLADPEKHWRDGYSAKALADSWEGSNGFPAEFVVALEACADRRLAGAQPYYAVPEYKTELPGGERPSQTDLLVFGRANGGAFAMAVEGKVNESFGPLLGDWNDGSKGKNERWAFLCRTLGVAESQPSTLRYQLFHRAASAVLAAHQHHASLAVLAVHSFSPKHTGLADFEAFFRLFAPAPARGSFAPMKVLNGIQLYAGWISSG
jgi:hypothetical protein